MPFSSPSELVQFRNCFILRDHRIIKEDLWVRDKKIINPEPVFFDEKITADVQIDCNGAIIAPGYIDLQVNGGFSIDFSHNTENIENGVDEVANGILAYGVTSFCPTIITSSPQKYHQIIPKIRKRDGTSLGAGILGIHLEGPFISREKKGAHPVQYIRSFESGFQEVLDVYGQLDDICLVTIAPELDPDGQIIKKFNERGITVSIGHSVASLKEGEKAFKAGASFITHLFNAMLPFHHRDPGLVGLLTSSKLLPGKQAFYGIIADGIHTHPATLRIAYKTNPEGLVLVTDAMSAMGLEAGLHYIGDQKVDVRDNRAVIADTDTLAGSITTMDSCVRYLKEATGCSTVEALESASLHPAQVLGITKSKGTLDFGSDADFILLDNDLKVVCTYIAGECVWESEKSRCAVKRIIP